MIKDKCRPELFIGNRIAPAPLKQVVVIGAEQFMDYLALAQITNWLLSHSLRTMQDRGERLMSKLFIPFNMASNPEWGDAVAHIRATQKVDTVVALHIRGLDRDFRGRETADGVLAEAIGDDPNFYYVGDNYELLPLCLERKIPLICWGDQPVSKFRRLPRGAKRTLIGAVPQRATKYLADGAASVVRRIYIYEATTRK